MKLIHLSDLHLGRRFYGFSLLEDQRFVLKQICQIAAEEQPDAVLIAGDVYDKVIPPIEAVQLFDWFLTRLSQMHLPILIISGNHDSPERVAFGSSLMQQSQVHLSPVFDGTITPVSLTDRYGTVQIYLLPFVRPVQVRACYPEAKIQDYQSAIQEVLSHIQLDTTQRNVLVTHQFVAGADLYAAQELEIGGTEQICDDLFDAFDYVALGHIHKPQPVSRKTMRYCGAPLSYSLSEVGYEKTITLVELLEKGDVSIRELPIEPLHHLRCIKGSYWELTEKKNYENTQTEDYIHVILTDEEDIPDAIGKLRTIYPNLVKLEYDNLRTSMRQTVAIQRPVEEQDPYTLFDALYQQQNNHSMSELQQKLMQELIAQIWKGELA